MSNEQKWCKVKKFQLQSMLNAIKCINQRFALKNSGFSCLSLIYDHLVVKLFIFSKVPE